MNISLPTQNNFLALSEKRQHKVAADALREGWETRQWARYQTLARYLDLPPLSSHFEAIADRFHYHLHLAGLKPKEHNLLIPHTDTPSNVPYLPIAIYLENLRSAHNVGSIFRTTEALRLGTLYLSPTTPSPANKKVRDAAMGTDTLVPYRIAKPSDLPRPLIALEVTETATPLSTFSFPKTFSLLLGNEEYGLTHSLLDMADYIVKIPLRGAKNSLNVANAYAIAANQIIQKC